MTPETLNGLTMINVVSKNYRDSQPPNSVDIPHLLSGLPNKDMDVQQEKRKRDEDDQIIEEIPNNSFFLLSDEV